MKYLTLAVLFAAMQTPAPVPKKTVASPDQSTAGINSKAAPRQANSPPTSTSVKADGTGPAKADSDEHHPEDAPHTVGISKLPTVTVNPTKRDWADWAYWGFNLLLVTVGGFQVYLLYRTLGAISDQASETRRQVDVTLGQLRAMHEQISEMSVQSGMLGESVAVARDAANAANANIELLINKERARIFVRVFPLELPQGPAVISHFIRYEISFHGPTFAFIEDSVGKAVVTDSPKPPNRGDLFGSISIPTVIPPEFPDQTCYAFLFHVLDQFEIDQINHGKTFVHFVGFIRYKDFMEKSRETSFCYLWKPQQGKSIIPAQWVKNGSPEANHET